MLALLRSAHIGVWAWQTLSVCLVCMSRSAPLTYWLCHSVSALWAFWWASSWPQSSLLGALRASWLGPPAQHSSVTSAFCCDIPKRPYPEAIRADAAVTCCQETVTACFQRGASCQGATAMGISSNHISWVLNSAGSLSIIGGAPAWRAVAP